MRGYVQPLEVGNQSDLKQMFVWLRHSAEIYSKLLGRIS